MRFKVGDYIYTRQSRIRYIVLQVTTNSYIIRNTKGGKEYSYDISVIDSLCELDEESIVTGILTRYGYGGD